MDQINFITQAPAKRDKSLLVAYIWLFALGIIGAHQYYIGKKGRGFGYTLTLSWLTIGCWIDLFTLPAQVRQINSERRVGLR